MQTYGYSHANCTRIRSPTNRSLNSLFSQTVTLYGHSGFCQSYFFIYYIIIVLLYGVTLASCLACSSLQGCCFCFFAAKVTVYSDTCAQSMFPPGEMFCTNFYYHHTYTNTLALTRACNSMATSHAPTVMCRWPWECHSDDGWVWPHTHGVRCIGHRYLSAKEFLKFMHLQFLAGF